MQEVENLLTNFYFTGAIGICVLLDTVVIRHILRCEVMFSI